MSTTNELSALGAETLLERDLAHWPMARQNYEALNDVRIRTVRFGAFRIDVQFNPARIVSSGALTDATPAHPQKKKRKGRGGGVAGADPPTFCL